MPLNPQVEALLAMFAEMPALDFAKLSAPALSLLKGAAVDVNGLIAGVGEAWIDRMKAQEFTVK